MTNFSSLHKPFFSLFISYVYQYDFILNSSSAQATSSSTITMPFISMTSPITLCKPSHDLFICEGYQYDYINHNPAKAPSCSTITMLFISMTSLITPAHVSFSFTCSFMKYSNILFTLHQSHQSQEALALYPHS